MTQTNLECLFLEIMYVFGILNFGHCDLLGIWYLWFGISGLSGLGDPMKITKEEVIHVAHLARLDIDDYTIDT